MRKNSISALILAVCLMFTALPAVAESYVFEAVYAGVQLPEGVYKTVLTPGDLPENEAFIVAKGGTVEAWAADFAARGVLLQAYDDANGRVLVITALADVDAKRYFDINELNSDTRGIYRRSHGTDGAYTILGYDYDSISWKNFTAIGRFLQLRYSYREGGELVRRGYQRRTIRNGYTITMDMQVYGRQLTGGDNSALNRVFNTFTFSKILPMPELPLTLDETATAPVETGESSFTMKGKTKAGAKLTAVLMSFGTSTTQIFEATANRSGNYSLDVKLPAEDVYLMTLTVSSVGLEDVSKAYNIRYQEGLLPVQITAAPPSELNADEFLLAGVTDQTGVQASLSVNGVETNAKPDRSGRFSFTIDTSREGAYDIRLNLTKRGLQDRSFQYQSYRYLTQQAQEEALKQSAVSPSYAELFTAVDTQEGKTLTYQGNIIAKENKDGEWITRLALKKTDSGFEDVLILVSDADPGYSVDTPVTVYGQFIGLNIGQDASGAEERLPKLQLSLITGSVP
jgi:hypothetical protein